MPPRKKKLTAGPVDVDLTGSSPEPAPKPKRAQKAVVDLVQDEEDADLAMGRALQEEENAGAREKGMQDEVVVMEVSWLAGPAGARSVGTGASTVGSAKSRCFPGSEAWLERTAVARGRAGCLVCRHSCGCSSSSSSTTHLSWFESLTSLLVADSHRVWLQLAPPSNLLPNPARRLDLDHRASPPSFPAHGRQEGQYRPEDASL